MWKRVIAPAILVSVLWVAGSSISTYYFHRVYESHSRVLSENVATIRAAWAIQEALWRLHATAIEAPDKEERESHLEADELEASLLRRLAEAEKSAVTPEEQALVKAIRGHFSVYRDQIHARLRPAGLSDLLTTKAARNEKTFRLARSVAEPCRQLVELNERMLSEATARSARLSSVVNLVRLAFLITGPVIGVVFGLWIARGMHRSISEISVTLRDAAGNLKQDLGSVEIRGSGELPVLRQQAQIVVTQIRQIMEDLDQARRQAMLAERLAAVGELAAGIAHELRNPLTSVKLLIQTAAQRHPPAALAGKQLQVVQQEIGRMEATIQGLLDFARPPELHRVAHDLRCTIQRALNLVSGRADQQHIQVIEQMPEKPIVVDGDPEQLHQIFVNLLLNGIEAMPRGGTLTITAQPCAGKGHPVARVYIADSGEGVPASIRDRLFEPFASGKEHGTGLGLAISHRIAKEHGGLLSASNQAEGGAVFTLELPLSTDETHGQAAGN